MPSIIQTTTGQDYNLLGTFTSDDGAGNQYTYNVPASSVKMWLNFAETPVDRSNYSSGISAISYVKTGGSLNDPVQGTADFGGGKEFNTIRARLNTPNAGHVRVDFTSTTNALTFGDGSSDSPFSVSFWYNRESAYSENSHEHLIQKSDGTSNREISIVWHPNPDLSTNGSFNIRLHDGGGEIFCQVFPYDEDFFEDTWSHIVVTYDGSSSHSGVNFYINGALQTFTYTITSGYTAMEGVSDKLYIGATELATSTDGTFSELAFFSEELDQNTIRAIYYATKDGAIISENNYYSGTVSNPVKDVIKTLDSRIKNIHDCGVRKSTQKRNFNDLDTIDFVERELIGSIGVEEGKTSTPYVALNSYEDYGITVTSKFDSTYTTNQVRNDFKGDIEPFKENEKIFLGKNFSNRKPVSLDIFEQSGLSRDINHKDIIEIDVKPVESTTFGIEQGVGSGQENNLMVYWNNKEKKWEKTGGTQLKPTSINSSLITGKIGFAPTSGFVIPENEKNFKAAFKNYGLHIDNFGFPRHPKYQADEDQYIEISDYICEPFLLEAIAYEVDTVLHVDEATSYGMIESKETTNFTKTDHVYSLYTFFILNERDGHQYQGKFTSKVFDLEAVSNAEASIDDDSQNNQSDRDLVCYSQIAVYSNAEDGDDVSNYGNFESGNDTSKLGDHNGFLAEGLTREANIAGRSFIDSGGSIVDADYAHSGSLVLSGTVNENGSHESYGLTFNISGGLEAITDLGAYRSDFINEKIFPRGFGNSVINRNKNNDISFNHTLFPGTSTTYTEEKSVKKTFYTNSKKPNPYILLPGDKLILGWQTPVSFDLASLSDSNGSSTMSINTGAGRLRLIGSFLRNKRQQKSSDIFYENNNITKAMGKGVMDTYQTETRDQLKDSYVSYEFSGDAPNRSSVKKEASSTTVKSSIHFGNFQDNQEIFYDSLLPDVKDFVLRRGASFYNETEINASDTGIFFNHQNWAPVYTQKSGRQRFSNITVRGFSNSNSRQMMFSKGFDNAKYKDNNIGSNVIYYGMHNYNSTRNSAQFNTRHFGYYSDMIQQRKICAYREKGKVIYPIDVLFFNKGENIKGEESVSQNIYPHAESYFPFFEGGDKVVTFRTDDTKDIDEIEIRAEMLDEEFLRESESVSLQQLNRIILK